MHRHRRLRRSQWYLLVVSAWICSFVVGCTTPPPPTQPPAMQPRVTQLPPTTTPTVAAANTSGPTLSDQDSDGIADSRDHCPFQFNPDQADRDLDGQGDDCETTPNLKPTKPVGPRPGEPDAVATVGGALK
jgi:hypothetical protein